MAVYRNISMAFWTDSKVDDDFTPEDKYFFLYLITNPHTNICGCYEISMKQMERETGYNIDTVKRLLSRMEKVHDVIRYNEKTKEVLILNWGKYNWTASEKVRKAVEAVADHIKNEEFKRYVMDMVSIGNTYCMVPSVTDTVTETVSETESVSVSEYREDADKPRTARFRAPSVEEVAAYCRERRNNVDPQKFVDYYTSNGWRVGKNPMKDWKAAVRTWEKSESGYQRSGAKKSRRTAISSIDESDLRSVFGDYYDGTSAIDPAKVDELINSL